MTLIAPANGVKAGLSALMMAALPFQAAAQNVSDCDWRASARAVVEPWENFSRTFANDRVRVALIDAVEPAAGAMHLLVLTPPYQELGERLCKIISWQDTIGFAALDFRSMTSDYDPARGLVLALPGIIFDPASSFSNGIMLTVTINQATGNVSAEVELGSE